LVFRLEQKRDEETGLLEQRGGQNIVTRNVGRMDSGQFFSIFNEWMKRLEYVIESGGERYTKQKRFALIASLFAKIARGSTILATLYHQANNIVKSPFCQSIVSRPAHPKRSDHLSDVAK
jgi:hypothetical protein